MRIRTVLKFVALLVVVASVAVVTLLSTMDFSRYRPLVAEKIREATGRNFEISGDLRLAIGLSPAVVIEDVRLQNATFGTRAEMIKAHRLEASVALLPLLLGRVEINRLALIGPDILLETDAQGRRSNWDFSREDEPIVTPPETAEQAALDLPHLKSVMIENGLLTYRDGVTGKITKLEVVHFMASSASRNAPLELDLSATYDGVPFHVAGRVGAFQTLGSPAPFPVDLTAETTDFQLTLKGTVERPLAPTSSKLSIEISSSNLNGVSNLIKIPLPAGPLAFSGHLTARDGTLALDDIKAKLAGSDLAGNARLQWQTKRPTVTASLAAEQVNLADFQVAPQPPAENGAKAKEAKGKPEPNGAPDGRLFSAEPLPLAFLKSFDGRLDAKVGSLSLGRTTLEQVLLSAVLKDGRLTVEPISGVVAAGKLAGTVALDAHEEKNAANIDLRISQLDVNSLAQSFDLGDLLVGKVDVDTRVSGRGMSLRELMAGLNGTASIVMGKGEVKSSYVELLGADLLRFAANAGSDTGTTAVNCLVGRFDITKGIATARDVLFDTDNMTVKGEGAINLATERLALKFTPRPKDVSLVNLAVPWRVEGQLAKPEVSLDEAGVATRAAGALLSVVNPLALVVPMVTMGDGDKNPCLAALDASRQAPAATQKNKKEPAGIRGLIERVLPGQ